MGVSGSLRVESRDAVDDDDETVAPCSESMLSCDKLSTGFVPSSSGVVAPSDDGDASGNGEVSGVVSAQRAHLPRTAGRPRHRILLGDDVTRGPLARELRGDGTLPGERAADDDLRAQIVSLVDGVSVQRRSEAVLAAAPRTCR